ncbi:MAG: AAA family ATPase [Thermoplasmata archaeon]|nr:AAA family ATPase [Thermoplasmata archaeon]
MSFMSETTSGVVKGEEVPQVDLLPELDKICSLVVRTCEYFFKGKMRMENAPFKGFILEGPPGTGKTEIVKQAARRLDTVLGAVYLRMVDGASIAAPRWGDAERRLRQVFGKADDLDGDAKTIILFDDIECLMITRGVELAKEWHYSINSILFHELDSLDPYDTIVCATSNRIDLVDEALKTRLHPITAPSLSLKELKSIVEHLLDAGEISQQDRDHILNLVVERLSGMKNPTMRDARQITVVECIKSGVWSA